MRLDLPVPHALPSSYLGAVDVALTNVRHINEIRVRRRNFTLPTGYISVPGGAAKDPWIR
jgi:hypothetical protein